MKEERGGGGVKRTMNEMRKKVNFRESKKREAKIIFQK
jgi:hypothetical protein